MIFGREELDSNGDSSVGEILKRTCTACGNFPATPSCG
jgi:hypothetical protein